MGAAENGADQRLLPALPLPLSLPPPLSNRRLVSSVGRAPVCRAGGRGFKLRPDQR